MDEEDDDIYEPETASKEDAVQNGFRNGHEQEQEELDDEGEDMDESTDDEVNFIIDKKPATSKPETTAQSTSNIDSSLKPSDARAAASFANPASPRPESTKPGPRISAPQSSRHGTDYPAIHNTTIDPDAPLPSYTLKDGSSKPLVELDFDADLAEQTKPWRLPGSDMSDYFNYGFDEFSWATYCLKQQQMRGSIKQDDAQRLEIQAALGGLPGGPAMSGMPAMPGMPGMQGMPDMNPDMMNAMMQQMQANGMDPSQMDFGAFMQNAHGMQGGGQGMHNQGPPQGAPLGPGQGQQQGGYDNRQNFGNRRRGRW